MSLNEIIVLIGFILGSILHTVLSVLIVQRKNKKGSELVFLGLVISVAIWHYGNTISIFCIMLFGKNIPIINQISNGVAFVGMVLIPSLLLHTAIIFLLESGWCIKKGLKFAIVGAIYLPIVLFSVTLKNTIFSEESYILMSVLPFVKPFVAWLMFSILASAYISRILSTKVEEVEERKFHFSIFWVLIFIAIIIGFTVLLEGRAIAYVGDYLILATILSSIFPSVLFAYYVYRYNYMEFVLRRSVFYSFLALIIICLYYFGIRQLSKYLELTYSVNAKVLEAVFVIALVYWFPIIKEKVQGLMIKLLFKKLGDREYLLNDLSHQIAADTLIDLSLLLENVVKSIKKATAIRNVNLILFKGVKTQLFGSEKDVIITKSYILNIIRNFDKGGITLLDRHEITDVSIINEMKQLDIFFVFPIFKERKLIGILTLGKSRRGLRLPADNLEQLMIIANQISSAIAKAEIIDEKLQLERKMYENEKLSSLGRLSTSVAHEVKNPLSSIKAIVQVLIEDYKNESKTQKSLSIIVEEIDRLTKVVNQLLGFAKPYGDIKTKVGVDSVINKVFVVLKHEAKQNNVEINLDILSGLPLVNADEESLTEVFFNIIHNAIQAMVAGGTLNISAGCEEGDEYVKIVFEDTGPGISNKDIGKIFGPFYTTKQAGTGLGLAIVKKKLEELRGMIQVKSDKSFTQFTVYIPLAKEEFAAEISAGDPVA